MSDHVFCKSYHVIVNKELLSHVNKGSRYRRVNKGSRYRRVNTRPTRYNVTNCIKTEQRGVELAKRPSESTYTISWR